MTGRRNAMRIITGSARGTRLKSPAGDGTRPTADRTREALFSMLGSRVVDARVLDLFAGTGALALEALSRGAASAVTARHMPFSRRMRHVRSSQGARRSAAAMSMPPPQSSRVRGVRSTSSLPTRPMRTAIMPACWRRRLAARCSLREVSSSSNRGRERRSFRRRGHSA